MELNSEQDKPPPKPKDEKEKPKGRFANRTAPRLRFLKKQSSSSNFISVKLIGALASFCPPDNTRPLLAGHEIDSTELPPDGIERQRGEEP